MLGMLMVQTRTPYLFFKFEHYTVLEVPNLHVEVELEEIMRCPRF